MQEINGTTPYPSEIFFSTQTEDVAAPYQKSIYVIVISIVTGVVGLLGNSAVIFVIMRTERLRKKLANLFIVNQCAVDFLSSGLVICIVIPGTNITSYEGMSGWIVCSVWSSNAFLWGLVFSSTYSLIALTIERYLSIVHPVWHKVCFSNVKAYFVMLLTWVAGLVEGIAHSIPTSIIVDGMCYNFYKWPNASVQKMAGVLTCTLHYILPMCVLIFCYGKMIRVISKRINKVGPDDSAPTAMAPGAVQIQHGPDPTENPENHNANDQERKNPQRGDSWNKARRNVIYTLSLISLCFALCWSMNQIYYLMMTLGFPYDFTSTFYNITVMAIHLNACINPFIYIWRYEQFKSAAFMMMKCSPKANHTQQE